MEKRKVVPGPIPGPKRLAYRARLGSDLAWRRPTELTAAFVWSLLEGWEWLPPVRLDSLLPKRGRTDDDVRTAKQSLVVALDCAITAGDRDAMLTKNILFDTLALRWSRQYRQARRRGARISYDMRPGTVDRALRELLLAGVHLDALWEIVSGRWSQSGLNRLFSVRRASGKGHPRGYRVDVSADSVALQQFETAVEGDGQYRRRQEKWPLLLDDDRTLYRRRVRQRVCAERPYNIVNLGEGSERVLSILESARVQFHVDTFRRDYDAEKKKYEQTLAAPHRADRTPEERRQYRKLKGFVAGYRRLRRQIDEIPVETDTDLDGSPISLPRTPWIRSRFFRASNRRYHAENFWPERAPKEFRSRWFSLPVHVPEQDSAEPGGGPDEPWEHGLIEAHTAPGRYVERDVVTSQIQTLAVFLGIEELEALAVSQHPTLKEWLADRLWTQHRELLADGYEGEEGHKKLVAFAKAHLMRFYGGDLGKIIGKCGRNPEKYGPGWKTRRGLWAKPAIKRGTKTIKLTESGVTEAVARATEFFEKLPEWIDPLENFLGACRTLAEKRDGVVFHDPLDEAEVRWNHAQRATFHVGHEEIEVQPSGKESKLTGFVPLPAGTVDRSELARFIAPCATHMLDSYFSSLVLKGLQAAGVTDVVALHDAWLVPEALPVPDDPTAVLSGAAVLKQVIEAAGKPWLLGLRGLYNQLVSDLGDDPTFGPFVHDIRDRWRKRCDAGDRWPKFLSQLTP